ncbi:VOC family protein [Pseudokineococcus basanitobsidens]|uniref:VOC family protein n=1 Tax=Pseudokineococcus basanitobsidens TaxID=1926649 RepID=A0ABU8RPF6_9ACTN
MRARVEQLVINARDPRALVRFWAQILGGEPVDRARGWSHVEVPGSLRMAFQPDPDVKGGRNRLHPDLEVDDIEVAVARAVGLGAVRVGEVVTDEAGSFQVMQDPEGNEFCLVHD